MALDRAAGLGAAAPRGQPSLRASTASSGARGPWARALGGTASSPHYNPAMGTQFLPSVRTGGSLGSERPSSLPRITPQKEQILHLSQSVHTGGAWRPRSTWMWCLKPCLALSVRVEKHHSTSGGDGAGGEHWFLLGSVLVPGSQARGFPDTEGQPSTSFPTWQMVYLSCPPGKGRCWNRVPRA